jgi:hypothetical protein
MPCPTHACRLAASGSCAAYLAQHTQGLLPGDHSGRFLCRSSRPARGTAGSRGARDCPPFVPFWLPLKGPTVLFGSSSWGSSAAFVSSSERTGAPTTSTSGHTGASGCIAGSRSRTKLPLSVSWRRSVRRSQRVEISPGRTRRVRALHGKTQPRPGASFTLARSKAARSQRRGSFTDVLARA